MKKRSNGLECCCPTGITYQIKVTGDIAADPIWCQQCGCNLELEELPISRLLKVQLQTWVLTYGEWLDWDTEENLPNADELVKEFNTIGKLLTTNVKIELDERLQVNYEPVST